MNRTLLVLLVLPAVLAGCGSRPLVAGAEGPYRALNPGRWQPTAEDLRGGPTPPPVASPETTVLR